MISPLRRKNCGGGNFMSEMFQDCSISSAKLSVLLCILLCGVEGGDEESSYGTALSIQHLCRLGF